MNQKKSDGSYLLCKSNSSTPIDSNPKINDSQKEVTLDNSNVFDNDKEIAILDSNEPLNSTR